MEFLLVASQTAIACLGKSAQCMVQAQPVAPPSLSGRFGVPWMGHVQPKIGFERETCCVLTPAAASASLAPNSCK